MRSRYIHIKCISKLSIDKLRMGHKKSFSEWTGNFLVYTYLIEDELPVLRKSSKSYAIISLCVCNVPIE